MKKKIALLMACVMAFGVAVGGTLAWLTDDTAPVVNTFTDSDINITLAETDTDSAKEGEQHDYQMIPGHTITKDPVVTVKAGSEACYLFVQVTENLGSWSDNKVGENAPKFTDYLSYTLDDWTALEGVSGVYYKELTAKTTADTPYNVIKDTKMTVSGNVTKAMMDEIDGEGETKPTLTFKAYASQLYTGQAAPNDKFTPAQAWTNVAG